MLFFKIVLQVFEQETTTIGSTASPGKSPSNKSQPTSNIVSQSPIRVIKSKSNGTESNSAKPFENGIEEERSSVSSGIGTITDNSNTDNAKTDKNNTDNGHNR